MSTEKSTGVKMKTSSALELRGALSALDGYQKAVGDKSIFIPYKFKDSTRKKIVINLRILKSVVEDAEERRISIVKEMADPSTPGYVDEMDGVKQSAFAIRWREIKKELIEVKGLQMISREELFNEEKNPIPGTVEEALEPVMSETKKDEDVD